MKQLVFIAKYFYFCIAFCAEYVLLSVRHKNHIECQGKVSIAYKLFEQTFSIAQSNNIEKLNITFYTRMKRSFDVLEWWK